MRMKSMSVLGVLLCLFFLACGGGGGGGGGGDDGSGTATGVFKDSNVSGLSYASGDQSGVTSANGRFTYEVGETVTFSIGGVTIGTASGKSVITPIDLIANGSLNSTAVINIVRFLMMLDSDGDPDNGISISDDVQAAADAWDDLDFGAADFDAQLAALQTECIAADGGAHEIPDSWEAGNHLEASALCAYSGAFRGTFGGDESGQFGLLVDASTGDVTGVAYVETQDLETGVYSNQPISLDQNYAFVSGFTDTGATFRGRFPTTNRVTGDWEDTYENIDGTFSGQRIGGSANAVYRLTGDFRGDAYGVFSIDIDNTNAITGIGYSVGEDESFTITGTLSGTSVTATTSNGSTITGTFDNTTRFFYGGWVHESGDSGIFSGCGCQLN